MTCNSFIMERLKIESAIEQKKKIKTLSISSIVNVLFHVIIVSYLNKACTIVSFNESSSWILVRQKSFPDVVLCSLDSITNYMKVYVLNE